jgi:hypothetical protein
MDLRLRISREMPEEVPKAARSWRDIAVELSHEQDPHRVTQLARELNEAMFEEEREKVRNRVQHVPGTDAA